MISLLRGWATQGPLILACAILQGCAQSQDADLRRCPSEPATAPKSPGMDPTGAKVSASFHNKAGTTTKLFWADAGGGEVEVATLSDGKEVSQQSYPGHVFMMRSASTGKLMEKFMLGPSQGEPFIVSACAGSEVLMEEVQPTDRWSEFERLAAEAATSCEGSFSEKWSCSRHVTSQELKARDSSLWGFHAEECEKAQNNPYKVGTTVDHMHKVQQKFIPNVTAFEGGYLRMKMTDKLMELLPWYQKNKGKTSKASFVPGFFTNNHVVHMDMLGMEGRGRIVQQEMQEILEWWTKKSLRHTTTFGIRVYRRGAMLINHLDRKDSHLVSAILQVHQRCDEGGGWPVEVIHPHSGLTEVYLQPGEMLLYEGARIEHGRPMRFRGEEFANIFSHFVPVDYRLNERWRNPHLDLKDKAEL